MAQDGKMPGTVAAPVRTILIVEDSENSAVTLEVAALDIPGVTVVLAADAEEAWRILSRPEHAIHVVITDLNLPRMDGFELIARVRRDARLGRIPIIVVSADTDPATPQRIRRLGADAFFPKPFSPAEVCRKLEQLLNGPT